MASGRRRRRRGSGSWGTGSGGMELWRVARRDGGAGAALAVVVAVAAVAAGCCSAPPWARFRLRWAGMCAGNACPPACLPAVSESEWVLVRSSAGSLWWLVVHCAQQNLDGEKHCRDHSGMGEFGLAKIRVGNSVQPGGAGSRPKQRGPAGLCPKFQIQSSDPESAAVDFPSSVFPCFHASMFRARRVSGVIFAMMDGC